MTRDDPRPTVFLDRDGTLNVDKGYVHRPADLVFLPGVPQALHRLCRAGFRLLVVTNQSGVARGLYTEADVDALHAIMGRQLAAHGVVIERYYYCPFHPDHGGDRYRRDSEDRKPGIGMFRRACRELAIDVPRSYMVGDKLDDMTFGKRAGLRSILVGTDRDRDRLPEDGQVRVARDLPAAVNLILTDHDG